MLFPVIEFLILYLLSVHGSLPPISAYAFYQQQKPIQKRLTNHWLLKLGIQFHQNLNYI